MYRVYLTALGVAGAVVTFVPAALAIPIHVHKKVPVEKEVVKHELTRGGDAFVTPATVVVKKTVVDVVHVPPVDEDDDGIADAEDSCIGYCPPPEPEPTYVEETSTEPAYTEPAPAYSGGTSNSTVMCESCGDYAANTGNGYYGGYQFDTGTWDAYGDPAYGEANEAPPAVQDAAAASVPYDAWPNC